MNIAKALKVKNRLAGEITRLQTLLQSSNKRDSRVDESTIVFRSDAILKTLAEKINELIELKTKIALANAGIFGKIEELAQTKSLLSQVTALNTTDQPSVKVDPYNAADTRTYSISCFVTEATKEELRKTLQSKIESLQDEIDDYNAKTQI
jgi:hypothetical protein